MTGEKQLYHICLLEPEDGGGGALVRQGQSMLTQRAADAYPDVIWARFPDDNRPPASVHALTDEQYDMYRNRWGPRCSDVSKDDGGKTQELADTHAPIVEAYVKGLD